jgi:16S rRNA (guanine1207-N2)-methyltransferase
MDASVRLLLRHLSHVPGPALWIADEHIDRAAVALAPTRAELHALSNRCDVAAMLRARGVPTALNDFELTQLSVFEHALFRVAKEKALVHHVINRALELLPSGGTLTLSGFKGDGIKTFIAKTAARAQSEIRLEREGGALLGVVTRAKDLMEPLDDQNYTQLQRIELAPGFTVCSKPGIFGWKKIDEGSRFLFDHIDSVWPKPPQRMLDLGCGYGYLSVRALKHWSNTQVLATDNNIAAINACARNLQEFGKRARCISSDAGETIDEQFDAILCNPPFHQGFAHQSELTEKFLRRTQRLLTDSGRALFVINQFIDIEKPAAPWFRRIDIIARNAGFKLLVLER